MSKENCKNVSSCKQSFKAVENFLRRVAFNLGNTQSRTEVKIISCIPIDVTDLQQRIFQLQNELADVKAKEPTPTKPCTACAERAELLPKEVFCNECLLSTTSVLSVFCPGFSSTQLRRSGSVARDVSRDHIDHLPNTGEPDKRTSFFRKKKKGYKKKLRSRLVYRAQTDTNTPFNNTLMNDLIFMKAKASSKREHPSRSYLADIIKRQYQHRLLRNRFSNLSDISSPICRDQVSALSSNSPYVESDVCSCFHGQFQNIDKYINNKNEIHKYPTIEGTENIDKNVYYDSKFYDLVPVKEKKNKHNKNDSDKYKRELKSCVIKCWPEKAHPKHNHTSPTVVNYCTVSPLRDQGARFPRTSPNDKHAVMNSMAAKRVIASTPRSTEVEVGPIYAKQLREPKKPNFIITTQRHNVATDSPAQDNTTARQTATSAATITDPPEDKTETTLNQIKNMLQCVLTEVKTNSIVTNPSEQPKKDAVVQNGPTQSYDYGASKLLQSYTYSPYNMNPYIASCSHPISCSNYTYPEFPGAPGIPFQQYPLLIQPQKHLCNNYYRNSNFTKPVSKQATSAATNTEQAQERSKETEQLIKEIYKSMALNMEVSSKDNSFREYTKPKSTAKNHVDAVKMDSDRESRSIAQAISEIFRNTHPQDSTVTGTTDTTLNSYLSPNKAKVHTAKKDYKTEGSYTQNEDSSKYRKDRETERMTTHHETEELSDQSDETVIEDTDESSTATEAPKVEVKKEPLMSAVPVIPAETKKVKSGIFKKMLKIFHSRRKKIRRDDAANESQKESESDSDDYQTVYSHKVVDATPKSKKIQTVRSRPHSKVFYSKQPQKRRSRTKSPEKQTRNRPYMEQENRRYWNEKLMFHENQHQKRSTGPSRQTTDRDQRNRHVHYYQNYEARPVLVEPFKQVPLRMPGNVLKERCTASRNYYTRRSDLNENQPYNPGHNQQIYSNNLRNNINPGTTGPHFVTAKTNGNRKSMFAKGWPKKCMPQCAQQWKELILNG